MTVYTRRLQAVFMLIAFALVSAVNVGAVNVVATNEWTAAFCRAAGIENVHVLAPANLQHPPDYDLKPSDIPVIMEADLIVFAGYEGMMDRIRTNIAGNETELLQIKTVYSPVIIRESVMAIATAMGTEKLAEANLTSIDSAWDEAKEMVVNAGLNWTEAAVHFHQGDMAWAMGIFEVVSFGPAPPGAKLIAEVAESGADLIIDNWHNPISSPLQDVIPDAVVVELINFPGRDGTRGLSDVILFNAKLLVEALK